jgi:ketosteroid isomerase-like protein
MSQENVEVVRGIYEAVARRDDVSPFEVYAEDIVWDASNLRRSDLMMKRVYQGHEGVRQFWREAVAVFEQIDFEVEELIDAGDQVLAVIREREVGRASGVPVEATHFAVWTLADRKVTRLQSFDDRQQALETVGCGSRRPVFARSRVWLSPLPGTSPSAGLSNEQPAIGIAGRT